MTTTSQNPEKKVKQLVSELNRLKKAANLLEESQKSIDQLEEKQLRFNTNINRHLNEIDKKIEQIKADYPTDEGSISPTTSDTFEAQIAALEQKARSLGVRLIKVESDIELIQSGSLSSGEDLPKPSNNEIQELKSDLKKLEKKINSINIPIPKAKTPSIQIIFIWIAIILLSLIFFAFETGFLKF